MEAPSRHAPLVNADKFARLIVGSTATLLGYWHYFNEVAEVLEKKDALLSEKDKRLTQLVDDLTRADAEIA